MGVWTARQMVFYYATNIQKDLFQVTLSHKLPGLHSFVSLADTLLAGLLTGERLDKQTYTKLHDKDKKEKM